MKIGIASDHRGFNLKKEIIDSLSSDYQFVDLGTNSEESTDYPLYAFKLGEKVINKEVDFGIAICGSGIGISIACNKVKGIRCAKVENVEEAKYTRNDNNANVLALSEKVDINVAKEIINTFVNTPFSNGEKHIRRIKEIEDYENER